MLENAMNVVLHWGGGSGAKSDALRKKSDAKKREAVRNFWNHHKAEKLGDYIFSVIFAMLFQALSGKLSAKRAASVYITVFRKVAEATVRFTRTRAMPLVCYSSYLKSKRFTTLCERFLAHFGTDIQYSIPKTMQTIRVNGLSKTHYVSDSKRAETQHELYTECLMKVKAQLEEQSNDRIEERMTRFQMSMGWIGRVSAPRRRKVPRVIDPPSDSAHSESGSSTNSTTSISGNTGTCTSSSTSTPTAPIPTLPGRSPLTMMPSFQFGATPPITATRGQRHRGNMSMGLTTRQPAHVISRPDVTEMMPLHRCDVPGCQSCPTSLHSAGPSLSPQSADSMDAMCTLECEHVDRPPPHLFVGMNRFVATSTCNGPIYLADCELCAVNMMVGQSRVIPSHHHRPYHQPSPSIALSANDYCPECAPPCHTATRYSGAVAGGYCRNTPCLTATDECAKGCRY